MGKCKNIECENKTEGKRVYCSMKCRNYYVNKYLRDYTKNSVGLSKESTDNYETNPKFCIKKDCGEKIPYNKRRNNYCNNSCKASDMNLGRTHSDKTKKKMGVSRIKNVEYKVKKCKGCPSEIVNSRLVYCSDICKEEYRRKDMSDFLKYKADTKFDFGLSDYPNKFNFELIMEHGWYSPSNSSNPNLGGVSRDHMLSVRDGFNKGVNPKLLAHPANCELMVHSENISKHKNSSITEDELIERIKQWER